MLSYYDDWKLMCGCDDEKVFGDCAHCDGEIYKGQEYYIVAEATVHEDCLEDYTKENLAELRTAGD